MREDNLSPVVVIDCSKNRIRIHRNALHMLGDPDYIVLLINPVNLTFAIAPSVKLKTAHAVQWEKLADRQCFELYSKPLICQLCDVCPGWNTSDKFRMTGDYIYDKNIVRFHLSNARERRTQL